MIRSLEFAALGALLICELARTVTGAAHVHSIDVGTGRRLRERQSRTRLAWLSLVAVVGCSLDQTSHNGTGKLRRTEKRND